MDSAKPYIDQAKQMASETAAVASDKARELASIAQAQGGDTLRQVLCLDYLHCATITVGVQHLAVICCYMHACSTGLPFIFPHSLHGKLLGASVQTYSGCVEYQVCISIITIDCAAS